MDFHDLHHMHHMPTVKVAMTPFPHSIDIEATVEQARAMMRQHEIRHLAVTEEGALVGVVGERDLDLIESSGATRGTAVRSACVRDVYVVGLDQPLDRVVAALADRHVGSALVVKRGKLVGILTTTDACRLLAGFLRARFPGQRDDDGDDDSAA